jgi:hypothetical protein
MFYRSYCTKREVDENPLTDEDQAQYNQTMRDAVSWFVLLCIFLILLLYGKTLHIPSFSKTCSPWTVCTFCVILEQRKCVEIFLFVLKVVISEQHRNILIFVSSTNF